MRSKACATRQDFSIESTASALMSRDVLGSRSKHTVYSTKLRYFVLIVIQRDDRENLITQKMFHCIDVCGIKRILSTNSCIAPNTVFIITTRCTGD